MFINVYHLQKGPVYVVMLNYQRVSTLSPLHLGCWRQPCLASCCSLSFSNLPFYSSTCQIQGRFVIIMIVSEWNLAAEYQLTFALDPWIFSVLLPSPHIAALVIVRQTMAFLLSTRFVWKAFFAGNYSGGFEDFLAQPPMFLGKLTREWLVTGRTINIFDGWKVSKTFHVESVEWNFTCVRQNPWFFRPGLCCI